MVNHPVYGLLWPICDRPLYQQGTIAPLIFYHSEDDRIVQFPTHSSKLPIDRTNAFSEDDRACLIPAIRLRNYLIAIQPAKFIHLQKQSICKKPAECKISSFHPAVTGTSTPSRLNLFLSIDS